MTTTRLYQQLCVSILCLGLGTVTAVRAENTPFAALTPAPATPEYNQWLWVDTKHKVVTLMDKNQPFKVFTHAAFGTGGIGHKHKRGDNITPKGVYRIGWNNDKSDFRNFFGLTYPSIPDAETGLKHHIITEDEYKAIVEANLQHTVPPQDTALGGSIGIHGLGTPLRRVIKHRTLNWTEGCIALTNEQIDELAPYVKPGMMVVID